jgi:hypothetical protein
MTLGNRVRLGSLLELGPAAYCVAAQLVVAAGILELAFGKVAFPSIVNWIRSNAGGRWASRLPLFKGRMSLAEQVRFARAAARFWRGPNACLPQSVMVLWILLSARHDADLVIGVSKDETNAFSAHAWVEAATCSALQVGSGLGKFAEISRH